MWKDDDIAHGDRPGTWTDKTKLSPQSRSAFKTLTHVNTHLLDTFFMLARRSRFEKRLFCVLIADEAVEGMWEQQQQQQQQKRKETVVWSIRANDSAFDETDCITLGWRVVSHDLIGGKNISLLTCAGKS